MQSQFPKAWGELNRIMGISQVEAERVYSVNAETWLYYDETLAWWVGQMGYEVCVTISVENGEYRYGYEIWHDHKKMWYDHNFSSRHKAWATCLPLCFKKIEKDLKSKK